MNYEDDILNSENWAWDSMAFKSKFEPINYQSQFWVQESIPRSITFATPTEEYIEECYEEEVETIWFDTDSNLDTSEKISKNFKTSQEVWLNNPDEANSSIGLTNI